MSDSDSDEQTFRYATTPGWWVPALLDPFALPALNRASSPLWWSVDAVAVALLLAVLYVLTHPTLRYSPLSFTQSRGPFRTSRAGGRVGSGGVVGGVRGNNLRDPQTGERRSNIRWFYKSPDDWGGKTPVQGYVIKDTGGHHMFLNAARAGAPWATFLLSALNEQPEVELGPRVIQSLKDFAR